MCPFGHATSLKKTILKIDASRYIKYIYSSKKYEKSTHQNKIHLAFRSLNLSIFKRRVLIFDISFFNPSILDTSLKKETSIFTKDSATYYGIKFSIPKYKCISYDHILTSYVWKL